MSIGESDSPSRKYLTAICPCGRSLRAPMEMMGREISCWQCHRMVRVPIPHSTERAFHVITDGLHEVFEARWLFVLFLAAAALTAVLCIPAAGVPLGALVLVLGAVGYGELIRQCGVSYWDFDDWKEPAQLLPRLGAAALFGLFLAAPLLFSHGGIRPPRYSTLGLLASLIGAMALPVAMFLAFARDDGGPLGWRRGVGVLRRYPLATLLALMLIPVGVVAAELVAFAISSWQGMFRFLLLDLFPGSEYFSRQYQIPRFGNYIRPEFPDARFLHLYLRRLHQGFMLTTALPATLSRKTSLLTSPWTLDLTDPEYLRIRAMYSQVVTMVLFLFLALQSRWLGALSTLGSKQSLEADRVELGVQA